MAGCDACVKVSNAGRIEIFDWDTDSNTWVSSKVFTGSGTSKNLGTNIEISSDGNYLVLSEKNGPFIVMRYDGTDWVQMGSSINNSDTLFFPNVSISDDGSTLAISQVNYDFNRGRTFIYQFENDWNLIDTLVGENQGDQFGAPVLSGDGNKLAVSATGFNSFKGKVYTYNYTPGGTTTWTLTGLPNTFIASNNNSYIQAHNFNKDGTRLVIGHNFGTTNNTGKILIYDYTPSATDSWTLISTGTTTWTNVSNEFIGENNYGIGANKSVQISSSGNQIAYGAPNFNGNIGKVILLSLTSTPTLTITSSDYGVNITDTVEIYFSSNKDTNDFTIEDISVTSGSISNFTSTSSKVYSVNYTPPSNSSGTVTFSVADNAFTDSSGSGNISSTLNILFDTISPTLSSFTDDHIDSNVRDADTVEITATFSEAMSNSPAISITGVVTNVAMTVSTTSASRTWSYSWNVPSGNDGTVAATVSGTDLFGNYYSGTESLTYRIDNVSPTLTITKPAGNYSSQSVVVTLTYDEAVTGLTTDTAQFQDLTNVASLTLLSASSDGTIYTVLITPAGDGEVILTHKPSFPPVTDIAGNTISSTVSCSFIYDGSPPTINQITSSMADGTYTDYDGNNPLSDTISVTVSFTESVTVDTTNGSPRLLLNTTPATYAYYVDGSGTATLTFKDLVNEEADADPLNVSALELNGGTIVDLGSNTASLTLDYVTSNSTNLSDLKNIVIDAKNPRISNYSLSDNNNLAPIPTTSVMMGTLQLLVFNLTKNFYLVALRLLLQGLQQLLRKQLMELDLSIIKFHLLYQVPSQRVM